MKKFALMAYLFSFLFITNLIAGVRIIEDMAYTENKSIRLYADVGKKHSIEIGDGSAAKETGEWWTVRAYIQNISEGRIRILLGRETNVLVGQPDKTSVNVVYEISDEANVSDIPIKPPVSDLRLVELEAGEVAQLPIANVQLAEKGMLKKMRITYSVGDNFAKWFRVWAGEITLVLDKDHPPQK